ncbi:MAG: RDD family protein [Acidobacteriota bacterium]
MDTPYQRATVGRRIFAKFIDMLLAGLAAYGFGGWTGSPMVGLTVGYGWLWMSDAWTPSPGKALLGLRALDAETAQACSALQSIRRNAPIVVLTATPRVHAATLGLSQREFTQMYPWAAGITVVLAVAWYVTARVSMGRDRWGRRPADRWAGTLVVRVTKKPRSAASATVGRGESGGESDSATELSDG